jgi:hypothetical protein
MEEKSSKLVILDETFQKKRRKGDILFFLFMLWPFVSLIASLKYFKRPYSKTIFILFCIFFGFIFIIPENKIDAPDSARYAEALIEMHNSNLSFNSIKAALYSQETNYVDIYQPLVTWFVSIFTGNPHFLFAIFAFVFGYFYANNLWLILNRIKQKISIPLFFFILAFALVNPIWNINGVRMWTAAQIFIYGVLLYFLNGNKKGLIWSVGSCLVHFSFLLPVTLLFAFFVLPKKLPIYFFFFILTVIFSEINFESIKGLLSFLPEVFQYRVNYYTDPAYVDNILRINNTISWHVKFSDYALKGVLYSMVTFLFFSFRHVIMNNRQLYILFCFSLFICGWANIASLVPSGSRFMTLSYTITFAFLILLFTEFPVPKIANRIKLLAIPFLIFYCLYNIRVGFDYMGISTFVGNIFTALLIKDTNPIMNFIK